MKNEWYIQEETMAPGYKGEVALEPNEIRKCRKPLLMECRCRVLKDVFLFYFLFFI